ncbi:MAG: hypothetical protein H6710_05745 [Myxococcales bacterium]|nr:hypothetical protein [Myxococcales bacterium]
MVASTSKSLLRRLADEIASLLRDDPRRVIVGEDVRDGGMLGLTRAAREDEALAARLLGGPLTPAAALAHATGLALAGRRPLVILPSASALIEGFAALRELGRISASAGGERSSAVVILAPTGPGFGLGGDGAESPEDLVAGLPGLRVLALGEAREAPALLRAAAGFDAGEQPTVVFLPRTLLLRELADEDVPSGSFPRALGAARRVREGDDATIFAWGAGVALAEAAVDQSGHACAIIDLSGLAPLDADALAAAAARTGKLVIVHPGQRNAIAAEVAALLADRAILHLDAPILRVGGADGPLPYSAEANALPTVEAIAAAIAEVATY